MASDLILDVNENDRSPLRRAPQTVADCRGIGGATPLRYHSVSCPCLRNSEQVRK